MGEATEQVVRGSDDGQSNTIIVDESGTGGISDDSSNTIVVRTKSGQLTVRFDADAGPATTTTTTAATAPAASPCQSRATVAADLMRLLPGAKVRTEMALNASRPGGSTITALQRRLDAVSGQPRASPSPA